MNEEIIGYVQKVFNETVESYKTILKQYFPSIKKKRFTERNQTFFFAHNYLKNNPDSIIWQELPIQFKNKKDVDDKISKSAGHIDTLIIDKQHSSIIFIEAKCLSKGERRIEDRLKAIQQDLDRLDKIVMQQTDAGICPKFPVETEKYTRYILILADIWNAGEGSESSKVLDSWCLNKEIKWGKSEEKSFHISCSCEEIAVDKGIVENTIDKQYSYNLLYRLYKA